MTKQFPHANWRTLTLFLMCVCVLPTLAKAMDCGGINGASEQLPQNRDATVDLRVIGHCKVTGTLDTGRNSLLYEFHNVNIIGGGWLEFVEGTPIDFYAESILVEYKGKLTAISTTVVPGYKTRLTIHLFGGPEDAGIECLSGGLKADVPCGIPPMVWASNPKNAPCVPIANEYIPAGDCFYQYEVQEKEDLAKSRRAYFGHKVLAVSFGGTLLMRGAKGAIFPPPMTCDPTKPGTECNPPTAERVGCGSPGSQKTG